MTKINILYHDNHPNITQLKQHIPKNYKLFSYESSLSDLFRQKDSTIFDLTNLKTKQKKQLFEKLDPSNHVFSDLTVNWGDELFQRFDYLRGAMALSFYSPSNTIEVSLKNESDYHKIEDFLYHLNLKAKLVSSPGICFRLPRIVSLIINEAYFSIEEDLASREGIDTAMKYGVNYPMGPTEWANKTGLNIIAMILDELFTVTQDQRYRISQKLKLDAQKLL